MLFVLRRAPVGLFETNKEPNSDFSVKGKHEFRALMFVPRCVDELFHSFLPGQSSTAFSEQNCSDGGPDSDFRVPRRKHAHCWRQMSPRGARQKEIVRDVTEKRSIRVSRIKKPAVSRQFFPFLHEA